MPERTVGEIAFDPDYRDLYLAVRKKKLGAGRTIGVIIATGVSEEEVREAIEKERLGEADLYRYHLFKPIFNSGGRAGVIIGNSEGII